MSISTSDDGMGFSDFETHHVSHNVRLDLSESTSANPGTVVTENEWTVTERGLDNDELAELVVYEVTPYVRFGEINSGTDHQAIKTEMAFGYNLAGDEYLAGDDGAELDTGTDGITKVVRETDEQGQLWYGSQNIHGPYQDQTNGVGAAWMSMSETEIVDLRDLLGSGPYLNATDDLTTRLEIDVRDITADGDVGFVLTLHYDVQDHPEGRPKFGF